MSIRFRTRHPCGEALKEVIESKTIKFVFSVYCSSPDDRRIKFSNFESSLSVPLLRFRAGDPQEGDVTAVQRVSHEDQAG